MRLVGKSGLSPAAESRGQGVLVARRAGLPAGRCRAGCRGQGVLVMRWAARLAVLPLAGVAIAAVAQAAPKMAYEEQVFKADGSSWRLSVPAGYRLELAAEMDGPRMLAPAGDGALLAGSVSKNIYRLEPPYTKPEVLAVPGGFPHGVAVHNGDLLVARTDGLYRAPYRPGARLAAKDFRKVAPLPSGGHASRTVAVGPDNRIYLSIGISGNCSDEYTGGDYDFDDYRGGVLVLAQDEGKARWRPFASGLRNPVGFDWHPETGALYASNHGPDHHGYDMPPEYFSRLDEGSFHGMPWFQFNGREVVRDDCIGRAPPRTDVTPPVATFPARNGPMGVAFVPRGAGDPAWAGAAVVALHGSWATRPRGGWIGPKASRRPPWLALVRFGGDGAASVEPLVEGFQNAAGERLARPVGVLFGADGALYFSSDGGAVEGLFRLSRSRSGH